VNILVQALEQYEGTYVVVSHDRHFISQVSNKVWYIEDHEIKQYPGSYEEFVIWMEDQGKSLDEPVKRASKPAAAEPVIKKAAKPEADTKKLEKEIAQIEEQIEVQEQLKAQLEIELAEVFSDEEKLKVVSQRYEEAGKKLEALNALWEEKVTALDS
jgi:ATP-binding cassette subfamily F protein 3